MNIKKGTWVEIESLVLTPEERSSHLPCDTKNSPLKMWVRGYLQTESACLGDEVSILTLASRTIQGQLVEIQPYHQYDFGETMIELLDIGEELKEQLSILKRGE